MGFVLSVIATVTVLLIIFVMLNRHYGPSHRRASPPGGAMSGWSAGVPSAEESPDLISEDVRQMRRAHEALRNRHGAEGMSDQELRDAVNEDEANRSRGRGPFALE